METNNNNIIKNPTLVKRTVERSGNLDVEGCLVLFPKYMLKLIELDKELYITDDKIGDRKACKILVCGALEQDSNEVCDILVYRIEEKVWCAFDVNDNCVVSIRRKGYDYYSYYPQLKYINKIDINYRQQLNALVNYVRIYSSASISVR